MSITIQLFEKKDQFKKDFKDLKKEWIPMHVNDFIKKLIEFNYSYAIMVNDDYTNALFTDEGNIECYNKDDKSKIYTNGKFRGLIKNEEQGSLFDEKSKLIVDLKNRIYDEGEVMDMKDIFVDIWV